MKIKIGVLGASSLTAQHLVKLVLNHKFSQIKHLVSESSKGRKVNEVYNLTKYFDNFIFEDFNPEILARECNLIISCREHTKSIQDIRRLLSVNPKLKIIDLSADLRLKDKKDYKIWYNFEHPNPELLKDSVYGLTEIFPDKIKKANLIANPGCYSTCVILGCAPLLNDIKSEIFIDAISGVSGAGLKPNDRNLAINVLENVYYYKVGCHQHLPEMKTVLKTLSNKNFNIIFVPKVCSFKYGITTTIFLKLQKKLNKKEIFNRFSNYYKNSNFIKLLPYGKIPQIKEVAGTNFCEIGFVNTNSYLIIITALDNLIKGAAGQAIQNMNLMFGLKETEGLL